MTMAKKMMSWITLVQWQHYTHDNRTTKWRHNRVCVTSQYHNNGAAIDGSFHRFICVSAPEIHVRNKIIYGLPSIMMFVVACEVIRDSCSWLRHLWKLLANHSIRDHKYRYHICITRENYWRITPLVTTDIVINLLRPSDPYMRQWTNHHWFR